MAIELVGGVERCTPVLNSPGHAYSLIGAVCSKRAVDVVGGELMVTGKKVKPEDYIPLWRQALADRKSIKRALDEDGVEVTFIARGHLERQRASSRHSTNDPMDGFTGWIAKLGKRMNVDADGYFTLRLDGIEMDACRDWHFIRIPGLPGQGPAERVLDGSAARRGQVRRQERITTYPGRERQAGRAVQLKGRTT